MIRRLLMCACVAAGFSSCASVSVVDVVPLSQSAPRQGPQKTLVRPFEFEPGNIRVDREGAKLEEFQRDLQDDMSKNLVERLRKYVGPTEALPVSAGMPNGDFLLVTGEFTRIEQGSRFLRSAVGFGSGGTKMDVTVTVSELSGGVARPLVMIRTSGGSNAMPGAIMGIISWPMILSGGEGIIAGVTGDCRRTSREIVAAVCDYLKKSGVQVAGNAPAPKEKGKVSWPLPGKKPEQ